MVFHIIVKIFTYALYHKSYSALLDIFSFL